MDSSTGVRLRFDDKLRAVAEYLHYREADPKLKIRLFNYFCTSWRRGSDLHDEQVILDDMPRQLKKLVYEHVSKAAESCVPMLKGLAAETIGQIFIKLKLVNFQVGEYMYHSVLLAFWRRLAFWRQGRCDKRATYSQHLPTARSPQATKSGAGQRRTLFRALLTV